MPQSVRAIITFLGDGGQPVDPSYGVPGYGGGHPSQGLPGGGNYPSQGLPGLPPHVALLPVFPFDPTRPDQGLPGEQPGVDNTLPGGGHPDQGLPRPGRKYVVKWLACHGLILVPDQGLPETPEPK